MNTPAHLLIGAALLSKRGDAPRTTASVVGSLLPDMSLYLLAGVSLCVLGIAPDRVFGELYYSPAWQQIFAIDNSILVWGGVLAVALWRRSVVFATLAAAALLHIACDLPLHHDDGRAHFWPLTDWVFESPWSYWDSNHHAGIIAPITGVTALAAGIVLWRRFPVLGWRLAVVILVGAEMWTIRQWILFF